MDYTKYLSVAFAFLLSIGLANYQFNAYDVDDDYNIQFKTGKAEGTFQGLTGIVKFDRTDLMRSMMDVSVDVNTIQTGNTKKDDHAKGKKWFDADTYPTMSFVSRSIEKKGTGYIAQGELTVKGVTRAIAISFTNELINSQSYLQGRFRINRKDFGIKGNFFGFTVGKNVDVVLKVPANYNK